MVTNQQLGIGLLRQSRARLQVAEYMMAHGNFAYVIRSCQEAVELALKGCLLVVGIDPPRWHDVGPVVRRERHRFTWLADEDVELAASISELLRDERERSMYGDEDAGLPPEHLYTRAEADQAIRDARYVHSLMEPGMPDSPTTQVRS